MAERRIVVWVQAFPDRPNLVLQWHDPETGRRKSKTAGTGEPKAAEAARADLEYELNHGKYAESSKLTWERFRELVEAEYLPNCRPKSITTIENVLNNFEEICHPRRLRAISERTISTFLAGLRKKPGRENPFMVPYTLRVQLNLLQTVLGWAVEQKLLDRVPTFPKVKVPKKLPQPVPPEAFEKLLAKAPDDEHAAFILCGWLAGLRLAEALSLEWEPSDKAPWLDLARERIVLPAEFVKAVKDQWVPLDPELRAALVKLPRHGRKVFRFPTPQGHPASEITVSHRIVALAKKAGVRLSMKTLRKGFGCYYAARVSTHVLQKLMRHSRIDTTMDYYANVDGAVEEAVSRRNGMRNMATDQNSGNGDKSDAKRSQSTSKG